MKFINTKKNKKINNKTKKVTTSLKLIKTLENAEKYKSFEENFEHILANKKTVLEVENDISKTLKTLFSPQSIKPQNDFYTYINYQWLKDIDKKEILKTKFYTQYDNFRIVQEKVYYDLINIVNDYIKKKTPLAKELENVYLSQIDGDDDLVDKHCVETINKIDEFIEKDDLYGLLAYTNRNEIVNAATPIKWEMAPNIHEPSKYINTITVPSLPFYDFDLYFDNDDDSIGRKQYKSFFRKKYYDYVVDLFQSKLFKPFKFRDEQLFIIGQEIAQTMVNSYLEKNTNNLIITKEESLKKYGFDWEKFSKKLGYKKVPKHFLVTDCNYLKLIMKVLNKKWKEYREWWIYINVKQQIRFSNRLYPIYFKFYRKYVQGAEFRVPKTISPVFVLSLCFDTLLSNEYITKFGVKENIDYTQNMANDLKFIFMRILNNNNWLNSKTKKYALLKLEKLKMVLGVSKRIRNDPLLGYSRKDSWGNIEKIYKWRLDQYLDLDGKDVIDIPQVNWGDLKLSGRQCYIVNAFYTPSKNDIYIPLAYLQKPFLDLNERGIEYNVAFLGFTIAHELSHALDNTGRKYAYDGKLFNWWQKEDLEVFQKKVKNVKEQYEKFYLYDKIKFDAEPSIGEDMADISAVAICEQYLLDFQIKNEDTTPIKILSFDVFFTYFAIQMRQSIAKKAFKAQLKVNPHPLDKYRVNVPLSRLKLFRDRYNIKKQDKMYWNTEPIW